MAAPKTKTADKQKDKPAAEENGKESKGKRPGPSVELKKIGKELPPKPARQGYQLGREEIVNTILATAQEPDEWFEIVHYSTRNGSDKNPGGARKMVAAIVDGSVALPSVEDAPEGAFFDVEFRNANYDGSGRTGSVLIARFVTEPEEAAEAE
jgi:hypothetical protein